MEQSLVVSSDKIRANLPILIEQELKTNHFMSDKRILGVKTRIADYIFEYLTDFFNAYDQLKLPNKPELTKQFVEPFSRVYTMGYLVYLNNYYTPANPVSDLKYLMSRYSNEFVATQYKESASSKNKQSIKKVDALKYLPYVSAIFNNLQFTESTKPDDKHDLVLASYNHTNPIMYGTHDGHFICPSCATKAHYKDMSVTKDIVFIYESKYDSLHYKVYKQCEKCKGKKMKD